MALKSDSDIQRNLADVNAEIDAICRDCQRARDDVTLLAVSKTKPISAIEAAIAAGHTAFGENYLQDALPKITAISDPSIQWHFIGQLQSNKAKTVANHFDWVHTVDRAKVAKALAKHRPAHLPPLNICLQVKVEEEAGKGGVALHDLIPLVDDIRHLANISLRGLMVIPPPSKDVTQQRRYFAQVKQALDELNQEQDLAMDTLSMGMSGDYAAAIAEGSTMVRVGTAIFGSRDTA